MSESSKFDLSADTDLPTLVSEVNFLRRKLVGQAANSAKVLEVLRVQGECLVAQQTNIDALLDQLSVARSELAKTPVYVTMTQ